MFQLSQLRCFVAVSSERNFRRAAARLNMTQPPVTRQIQLLEHDLGVKLLERSGRSVNLTAAGSRFFLEAQDILRRTHAAAQSARAAERGESGAVVVGGFSFANLTLMPKLMARLRQDCPGLAVSLREMTTLEQVEALASGTIELGVMRHPQATRSLKLERVATERIRLAVHRDHPLSCRPDLALSDLQGQRLLMHSAGPGRYVHDIVQGLLTEANIRPDTVQYLDGTQTMMAMVNARMGMALVPQSAASISYGDLVLRDIRLPRRAQLETWLGCVDGAMEKPALRRVRDALLALDDDLAPGGEPRIGRASQMEEGAAASARKPSLHSSFRPIDTPIATGGPSC